MHAIDYRTAIYDADADPLDYPSAIPAGPRLVTDDTWQELIADDGFARFHTLDGIDVDAVLAKSGAAPVSGRIAQIAFGAHRNIANIAWKFAQYARTASAGFSRDFVMVPAYLPNADVVACGVSSGGHLYSGLLTTRPGLPFRKYLLGTLCPVTLLLLDRSQMEAMHAMAGIPRPGQGYGSFRCDLTEVEVRLDERHTTLAQTYSVALPFMALHGRPLAFAKVTTLGRKRYRALTQHEMFAAINAELSAENAMPGATPIIDTINARRRQLVAEGRPAGDIAQDPLFASVKQALATTHRLVDEDGRARSGIEDVYEPLAGDALWAFGPRYAPASGSK